MRQILLVNCAKHEGAHEYRCDCKDWYKVAELHSPIFIGPVAEESDEVRDANEADQLIAELDDAHAAVDASTSDVPNWHSETEEWVEWVEPFDENSNEVIMRIRPATAVDFMQDLASERKAPFNYKTDQDALDDFLTCHWAYIVRYPKK